jgi:hypothetical protein
MIKTIAQSQIKPLMFKIALAFTAHDLAEQFSRYHSHPNKARQVYLNTLAVFAVNKYLNSLGWVTSLVTSDSWNPVLQALMDVADLDVLECGKLECRFILPEADTLTIPPEVWSERIGYIAVRLTNSLQQATLLGFVTEVNKTEIPLTELKSIAELSSYLQEQKDSPLSNQPVHLSQWLEGIFPAGWQKVDELLPSSSAVCFRSAQQLRINQATNVGSKISRVKLLELDSVQIALILTLMPSPQEEIEISVKFCPTSSLTHLPEGLQLTILDDMNNPVMQAQAKNTETIEFRFTGKPQEYFSIKTSLNNCTKIENFII